MTSPVRPALSFAPGTVAAREPGDRADAINAVLIEEMLVIIEAPNQPRLTTRLVDWRSRQRWRRRWAMNASSTRTRSIAFWGFGLGEEDTQPHRCARIINSALVSYERLPMLEIVFDRLVRLMTTSLRNFTSDNVEVTLDPDQLYSALAII